MNVNSILTLKSSKKEFSKSDILSALKKKFSGYKFDKDYINEGEFDIISSELITYYSCDLENFSDNRIVTAGLRPNNTGVEFSNKYISDFNPWDYKLNFKREFNETTDTHLIKESHHAVGCYICRERGKVDCSRCRGVGNLPCNSCQCTGKKDCSSCSGTTMKRCSSCSGKGFRESGYGANKTTENCSYCNGRGTSPCTTCKNGKVTCTTCDGKGRVSCFTCYESGEVTCHQCDGYKSMDHYFVVNADFKNVKLGLLISYPYPGFDLQKAESNAFEIQKKLFDCSESRFKDDYFKEIELHPLYSQIVNFFSFGDSQSIRLIKSRFTLFENTYIEVNFKFYGENYIVFFDE